MRLPPSAKQIATDPTASAHKRMTSGAYEPLLAASAAGTTKIEAPTTIPMMLAARPQGPTARTSPASRWLVRMCCGAEGALSQKRMVFGQLSGVPHGQFVPQRSFADLVLR